MRNLTFCGYGRPRLHTSKLRALWCDVTESNDSCIASSLTLLNSEPLHFISSKQTNKLGKDSKTVNVP